MFLKVPSSAVDRKMSELIVQFQLYFGDIPLE